MTKCQVCGMEVDERSAPHAEHEGQTYHFCGESCKERFAQDPKKYLQVGKGGD